MLIDQIRKTNRRSMQEIWTAFFPDRSLVSYRKLAGGHIHQTYHCRDAQGDSFLLQAINQKVFKDLERLKYNTHLLYRFLPSSAGGLRFPKLFPSVTGSPLHLDQQGAAWRMQEYLNDTRTLSRCPDPRIAEEAGRAVAAFLVTLSRYLPKAPQVVIPHFHDSLYRWRHFQTVLERTPVNPRKGVATEVEFLQSQASFFEKIAQLPLPQRTVHNDPKLGNLLFDRRGRRVIALIDWDTIMPGSWLSDFGDLVRSVCATAPEEESDPRKVGLRPDFLEALCRGFLSPLRKWMTTAELNDLHLGPGWIILEQAMRFLQDELQGNIYYPVDYPGHNLTRARNQLQLYRSYLDHQTLLRDLIRSL